MVATVLTVYGIETRKRNRSDKKKQSLVATVLTVYGIETYITTFIQVNAIQLQQYLPFTVLKLQLCNIKLSNKRCCNSTYRLRY